ncbi:hypothetical protein OH77DRAFT_1465554 [Trametes cingulata]|nr:hypothetical protein OH77DRAFT_1465554 [Trametes cingulata]
MFTLPSVVITSGLLRDPEENPQAYSALENRHYASFQALVKLVPAFALKVDSDDGSPEELQRWMDEFAACLQIGVSGAKSDDTRSLRGAVIDWLKLDFPADTVDLNSDTKVSRGFRNEVTGRLLCPVMLDWKDENVRTQSVNRTATVSGDPVNGSHWPSFLYASGLYDENLPWVGFLMGEYLLRTFRHIFTSPSSAKGTDELPDDIRATRSGNAASYGMTEVTKASIAYAAAQLYFVLSDSAVFNKHQKNCDAFGLYNAIRDYLEDPEFESDNNDLLLWWNRRVFPDHHVEKNNTNHGLAHMRAARAIARGRSSGAVAGGEGQQQGLTASSSV